MVASREEAGGNVLEFLSDYVRRLENVYHLFTGRDIIVSSDVENAAAALEEDLGIAKMPVLWPLMDYKMFYIVTVPPNTEVPRHRHDESVFRLIIEGELQINDVTVRQGQWVVVKKDVYYSVSTKGGYKALSGYTSMCRTRRGADIKETDVTPPEG